MYKSCGPWLIPEFRFRSISWEQIDRISPNFMYAFILTGSSLGVLAFIFCLFITYSYGPWFMSDFSFRSIIWEWIDRISPILYVYWYWQDLGWDCYLSFFCKFVSCNRVMALDLYQNFFCAKYLENKWIEFPLYMHLYNTCI